MTGIYRVLLLITFVVFSTSSAICAKNIIPVEGATANDWPNKSFWHPNWGESGVHKGIDIFADKGTSVLSSTMGLVIFKGEFGIGGNAIMVLGPWLKIHYYAHLDKFHIKLFNFVSQGEIIGAVGDTGNAKGRDPHLHYQIMTPIPYFWKWDKSEQGWKKMFYLNPENYIL